MIVQRVLATRLVMESVSENEHATAAVDIWKKAGNDLGTLDKMFDMIKIISNETLRGL